MLGLKKTAGSILVVSTLILSILAGLSIATMQNVVTEYQLSTHDQDKTLALQSAQYALAEAKRLVLTQWAPGAPPCTTIGGCVNASGVPVSTNGVAVWSYAAFAGSSDFAQRPGSYFISNAQATANVPNGKVAQAPRFFVIDLGCDPYSKVNIYRLIAMGFGASVQTTAYAESQLTMPLSGQNSYKNAGTTPVYGVAVTASAMPTQYNYNLAASTNSKILFFNSVAGTCSNPGLSNGSGATCERNCVGEVRVKAYSRYHTNSCTWVYGDWVSGTNQSTLRLNSDSSGGTASLSCGPCQMAMAVPTAVCPISGQYNSCTGNCVTASCPAGQYSNNGACTNCPANTYSHAGDASCTPCTRKDALISATSKSGSSVCTCSRNAVWNDSNGGMCACPSNFPYTFSNPGAYEFSCVSRCDGGRVLGNAYLGPNWCACPVGQSWNGSSCYCKSNYPGVYYSSYWGSCMVTKNGRPCGLNYSGDIRTCF